MPKKKVDQDRFLSPAEVAERLRVTVRTVYQWIADGTLPAQKVGRRLWRIRLSDLPEL